MKQKQKKHLKEHRKPSSRVFSLVLDKASFVHKIALSIDGKLKENFEREFQHPETVGIYGTGSLYSRFVSGKFWPTGNSVDLVYGRTKRFPNLSPVRITMHSEKRPVTAAEAMLLIGRLTLWSSEIRVSSVEFTFDFTDATIDYIFAHLIHRAKWEARLWRGKTIYIGSPKSAWEVRIYEKRPTILRLEFILRRAFLFKHGLNQLKDLLILQKLPVWDLLSVRRFSASSAVRVTRNWKTDSNREMIRSWGEYGRPLRMLPRILKNHGVHPHKVLRRTRLQKKLEAMQKRFVW